MAKPKAEKPKGPVSVDERGQVFIKLDGTEFGLRPSVKAILAIERLTGIAHADLAALASGMRMRLEHVGMVVAELMRAYGEANPEDPLKTTYVNANAERIAELVMDTGSAYVQAGLAVLLTDALAGGYTASGELKPTG